MACERGNLKDIEKLCGEGSAPDLKDWVAVTTAEDITNIPIMETGTWKINGDIQMRTASAAGITPVVTAGKFQKWNVAKTDNGYSSNRKDNHYEPKFEYFIEKLDEVKTFILAKARGKRLTVIGMDNNGKMRVMENAEVMFNEETKGKNGYKIEFSCGLVPDPLPYYSGNLVF